jgi:hypothetical protein
LEGEVPDLKIFLIQISHFFKKALFYKVFLLYYYYEIRYDVDFYDGFGGDYRPDSGVFDRIHHFLFIVSGVYCGCERWTDEAKIPQ